MSEPKVNAVVQIGIVVRSADEAMRHYAKLLGIDDWNINYVDTDNGKGRNFRVDGENVSVKAKIAWTNVGDIELELIEPQDDNSTRASRPANCRQRDFSYSTPSTCSARSVNSPKGMR
jgi:hypothetical protein